VLATFYIVTTSFQDTPGAAPKGNRRLFGFHDGAEELRYGVGVLAVCLCLRQVGNRRLNHISGFLDCLRSGPSGASGEKGSESRLISDQVAVYSIQDFTEPLVET
jgi:hypothetical protein